MVRYAHATPNKHHRRSERGGVQRRPGPRAVGGEEPRRRRARAHGRTQGRQGAGGEAVCTEAIRHLTNGYRVYLEAVESAGRLRHVAQDLRDQRSRAHLQSRAVPRDVKTISGAHVSTSYVERQNLTMRMREARSRTGSKKRESHARRTSNFVRIHKTLRTTPAQAAGVTDRLWEIADIVTLLDAKSEVAA